MPITLYWTYKVWDEYKSYCIRNRIMVEIQYLKILLYQNWNTCVEIAFCVVYVQMTSVRTLIIWFYVSYFSSKTDVQHVLRSIPFYTNHPKTLWGIVSLFKTSTVGVLIRFWVDLAMSFLLTVRLNVFKGRT